MNRSYLFVPADSERKMKKAADVGADALILDLEDSVAPDSRPAARELGRDYLVDREGVWVRINPVASEDAAADLEAVMPSAPTGIVLPKSRGADDVVRLAAMLDTLERTHGIEAGRTCILPICTETPDALFTLGSYAGSQSASSPRCPGAPRIFQPRLARVPNAMIMATGYLLTSWPGRCASLVQPLRKSLP